MLDFASHSGQTLSEAEHFDKPPILASEQPKQKKSEEGVALALGGGAARGWAHIGVLRALDESGIEISMIAGTSIGALVGGCYLAGRLDELEEFARNLTKRSIFRLLDFSISGDGLLNGMRLNTRMEQHLEGLSIEGLNKKFIAVATEITTGHEVWLRKGCLISAIRASYSLPGIFEPVIRNNRVLVDGALVNPVPVSVCRASEEKAVIAINLHANPYGRSATIKDDNVETTLGNIQDGAKNKKISKRGYGLTGVMVQSFNVIQERISRSRMAGDPPDFALNPILTGIGMADFHKASQAIDHGYEATMLKIKEIKDVQQSLLA